MAETAQSGLQHAPPWQGRPKHQRHLKNYLLDKGLQLRFTLIIVAISATLTGGLGWVVMSKAHEASRVVEVRAMDPTDEMAQQLAAQFAHNDKVMLAVLVAFGLLMSLVLSAYGIVLTSQDRRPAVQGDDVSRPHERREARAGLQPAQGRRAGRVLRALQGRPRRHARAHRGRCRSSTTRPSPPWAPAPLCDELKDARDKKVESAEVRIVAVALAAVCCCSGFARGQAVPGNASLSYDALAKSSKGAWAEYKMTVGTAGGTTMRYSLVEKTATHLAIEISTVLPPLVMRLDLVANGSSAWKLQRVRMKMGDNAVNDVPLPDGADQLIKKSGAFGTAAGTETLKTPAGSFRCKRYKQTTSQGQGEVWMSDQALPSGLVQTMMPSLNARSTLAATGAGAVAKIQ